MFEVKNIFPDMAPHIEEKQKPVILWAGRMLWLKNLYRLCRAFARANTSGEYELHLIGDGPERNRIRDFLAAEKLENIQLFFSEPREHLAKRLRAATLAVLPSFSEVGPTFIADAVAAGTPVLVTKETGTGEYILDERFFCDPFDEKDIEKKLSSLLALGETERRESLRQAIPISRDWRDVAGDLEHIFSNIIHL